MKAVLGAILFFFVLVALLTWSRQSRLEGFRGGEAIGGHTEGPAASELNPAEFFEDEHGRKKEKTEGFSNFVGHSEVNSDWGPGPASLNKPRQPYHLLEGVIKDAPRDTIGCLTAGCCNETDFEARTNLTGNYIQRTNNYKRFYPDNCTTPLHELTMSFYKTDPLSKQL